MKKQVLITIGVAVIFGAAGFFGGMKYQQTKKPTGLSSQQRQQAGGQFFVRNGNGGRNGQNGGGFVSGQIISKDDKSITVQLPQNAGSKIVFYSSSTQVNKPAQVDASQLANGQQVIVSGTSNSDGSVTAQNIQIREAMPGQQPGQGQQRQ